MRNSSMRLPVLAAIAIGLAAFGALIWSQRADAPPGPESADHTAAPTQTTVASGVVEALGSIPHEGSAWTEGLLVSDGQLWESTGRPTGSGVRAIDPATGEVLWSVSNGEAFFAEGMVRAFGRTYVLSYTEQTVFMFDREARQPFQRFATYQGEGWGLTAVGNELINSNGSADLFYRDPETFEILRTVTIRYEGQPVERLNELEYDGTYLWANQWQTPYVYRIDPADAGRVERYELPDFCPGGYPNGIAWDPGAGIYYVTGQRCPVILKVRFH